MPGEKRPSTSHKASRTRPSQKHYGTSQRKPSHSHDRRDVPENTQYRGTRPHGSQNAPKQAAPYKSSPDGADTSVRINKALADAGVCSRRKAEELIAAGKVFVNGVRITNLGHKVFATDELRVDGQIVKREETRSYLLFHKPVQTMCTAHDPEGRTTIFDILPSALRGKRLFTVGRLDYFSQGLLLLTDDGHFAQKLAHPRYHLPKIYEVLVRESVTNEHIARMQSGMTLSEGEVLAPVKARVLLRNVRSTVIEMTLHQGINRQIRRMCRDLNLTILRLTRVAQGPIELDIPEGQVRELSYAELKALQKSVGV